VIMIEKIQIEASEINLKDKRIFEAVFKMFYPQGYVFVLKLLKDEEMSADITQEAFLYLWEKVGRFSNLMAFKSYLYCFLRDRALNYIRDHKEKLDVEDYKDCIEDEDSVRGVVIEQEVRARILEEIDRLPGVKRDILMLRLEGYSYDEISKELQLSINTVKTHKKQAYKDLRISLSDCDLCVSVTVMMVLTVVMMYFS